MDARPSGLPCDTSFQAGLFNGMGRIYPARSHALPSVPGLLCFRGGRDGPLGTESKPRAVMHGVAAQLAPINDGPYHSRRNCQAPISAANLSPGHPNIHPALVEGFLARLELHHVAAHPLNRTVSGHSPIAQRHVINRNGAGNIGKATQRLLKPSQLNGDPQGKVTAPSPPPTQLRSSLPTLSSIESILPPRQRRGIWQVR